jgi:cytochrome P450
MSLARMEARVAISKLVQRFETLEHGSEFIRGGRTRFRGFLRYPLRLAWYHRAANAARLRRRGDRS